MKVIVAYKICNMDTLKLRKRILGIVVLMVFKYETFAQSYYMHEVAEDRGYNNFGLDFLEVLQWVIIIGIGLLFLVGFGIGWIKELFEDSSSNTHTSQTNPNEIVSQGKFYNGWSQFNTHSRKYGYIDINGNNLKSVTSNNVRLNETKYFKGCIINYVVYSDKVVTLTFTTPIRGYITTENGIIESQEEIGTISIPLNNIANLFEEDDDLAWLKNTILLYPFIVKRVLKGAIIDIVQQYIQQGEKYNNPFSDNNKPQIYEQDIIVSHCVKIKLAKDGEEAANKVADLMMGFPMSDIELIMEFANDAENKNQHKEALGYYKLAAEQGNTDAQYKLGLLYSNGQGVEQDYVEAAGWYLKAAEQGDAKAQFRLGRCYHNGYGVTQDYQSAVKWYCKAAEQGNAFAQHNLGYCYYFGEGVEQDLVEAVKWYKKAAEQGTALSQNALGDCYELGEGVEQNYITAVKWYLKAAVQGDTEAQFNLGVCYANGKGVEQSATAAQKWFRLAADGGHTKAKEILDEE